MERAGLGDLRPVPVTARGDVEWVVGGVRDWLTVGSLLPAGFSLYARLFHPARLDAAEVRWATVAAANGRQAHAGMQWVALTGSWDRYYYGGQAGLFDVPPEVGSLPAAQARSLTAVLREFTTAVDDCFFAVWNGFGDLAVPTADAATIVMPGDRAMALLRGSLECAAGVSMVRVPGEQSPNLWWAADRAWCVATDIDLNCTYIGAGADCVEAILGDPALEAWRVRPDDRVDGESDVLNPTPPRVGRGNAHR